MNYLEVYFNGVLKHSLPVRGDIISIGRASNNDIVINNMGVSNQHAIITRKDNLFQLEDLNSTNGTFLNSKKISARQKLNIQDAITIGKHTLKFSEWGESHNSDSSTPNQNESSVDATIMMSRSAAKKISQATPEDPEEKSYYLIVRGELLGINKLLLTEKSYTIGKSKDNDIRLGGWFTAAHIAKIEKIGHSFYVNPLKKNKVKLNNNKINSFTLLSPGDEIKIKHLFIKVYD